VVNIAQSFVEIADQYADRTAIVEARSGKTITFAEFNKKSDRYSCYLSEKGVKPGDIVVLMVTPSIEFICLTLALFKLGAPVVLIDPGMGYKNLLRCIERIEPKVLIGIPKAIAFAKLFKKPFRTIQRYFCCGRSLGVFGPNICAVAPAVEEKTRVYQPGKDELAAVIFTTGSTGPPKGVRYEHSIFSSQLQLIKEYYGIGPDDVDQPAFPLFALFSAALGATAIIPDMDATRPALVDPKKFVDSINKYKVTYSFGSPAIWNVVSIYCRENEIILHSINKVLMAGAPVPYDLLQRVTTILPPEATIFTPYGATESLPVASIAGHEILTETWAQSRLGKGTCVGRALPGIELQIMKISDDPVSQLSKEILLEEGEIGEIVVRGNVVTKAYQNNAEETRLAKISDGDSFWHRMGDVGYLDEKRRLWFCGRRAHRLETATGPMYTIPCEAIVNEHPEVFRSALVGVTKGKGQECLPVMIVELFKEKGDNKARILAEVRDLCQKNTLTQGINFFLVHQGFPVDIRHNAKIFREKLAVWAQQRLFPTI